MTSWTCWGERQRHIWNTTGRSSRPSFLLFFFATRAVVNWCSRLNHPIAQIRLVLSHIRFEHVPFVVCSYKFFKNCSTFYQPVRTENFFMHIIMHFLPKILLCSSAYSSCSNWVLPNHGILIVKWQILWKWENRWGEVQGHQLAGNRFSHWGNTRKSGWVNIRTPSLYFVIIKMLHQTWKFATKGSLLMKNTRQEHSSTSSKWNGWVSEIVWWFLLQFLRPSLQMNSLLCYFPIIVLSKL